VLHLLGGEPLLHPDVEKFFPIARAAFPRSRIMLISNGVLLDKQGDKFWDAMHESRIELSLTVYPGMEQRFKEALAEGERRNVTVSSYNDANVIKTLDHYPLDLEGRQDPVSNFGKCDQAGRCINLRNGRMYPCVSAAYVSFFNAYFNQSLPITEKDYIDIYKAESAGEISEFLSRPIPFCRFCAIDRVTTGHPWRTSRRDIREWSD
jgi:MoaA/NifB/PqqE/SkfB family radical SAM enzyme